MITEKDKMKEKNRVQLVMTILPKLNLDSMKTIHKWLEDKIRIREKINNTPWDENKTVKGAK